MARDVSSAELQGQHFQAVWTFQQAQLPLDVVHLAVKVGHINATAIDERLPFQVPLSMDPPRLNTLRLQRADYVQEPGGEPPVYDNRL